MVLSTLQKEVGDEGQPPCPHPLAIMLATPWCGLEGLGVSAAGVMRTGEQRKADLHGSCWKELGVKGQGRMVVGRGISKGSPTVTLEVSRQHLIRTVTRPWVLLSEAWRQWACGREGWGYLERKLQDELG